MENIELFKTLAERYGPVTAVGMFNLWIYIINPKIKKMRGTYVGYKSMNEKIGVLDESNNSYGLRLDRIEEKLLTHRNVLDTKQRDIEKLTDTQERIYRDMEDMRLIMKDYTMTQKTTQRLLGENKDALHSLLDFLKHERTK